MSLLSSFPFSCVVIQFLMLFCFIFGLIMICLFLIQLYYFYFTITNQMPVCFLMRQRPGDSRCKRKWEGTGRGRGREAAIRIQHMKKLFSFLLIKSNILFHTIKHPYQFPTLSTSDASHLPFFSGLLPLMSPFRKERVSERQQ